MAGSKGKDVIGRHLKGIRYLGVSGKGKGKRICRKITKQKVAPLVTQVTSQSKQMLGSVPGIH